MIRKSELAATPNLEQIVAAARGIPATVLNTPEQHPAARLSAAVRFQYLARVVAPGEVTAPAAKVEAMYEPQIYGLSRTLRVTATPLKLRSKKQVAQR